VQNNLARKLLFGAVAVICIVIAYHGVSLIDVGQNTRGTFYLAAGVMLGIPVAIGYYYYKGRTAVVGTIEYTDPMEILAEAQPKQQQNANNITQKAEDNHAAHTTPN
jgi:hypothetical protein